MLRALDSGPLMRDTNGVTGLRSALRNASRRSRLCSTQPSCRGGTRALASTRALADGAESLSPGLAYVSLATLATIRRCDRLSTEPSDIASGVVGDFTQSHVFDLPHSLACDAHDTANFFERHAERVLAYGTLRGGVHFPFEIRPRIGYVRRGSTASRCGSLGTDLWHGLRCRSDRRFSDANLVRHVRRFSGYRNVGARCSSYCAGDFGCT